MDVQTYQRGQGSIRSSVGLLELDPDLASLLSREDRELAERVILPVITLRRGKVDLDGLLHGYGAFAGVVLEGVVLHRVAVGRRWALTLLGPGEVVAAPSLDEPLDGVAQAAEYAVGVRARLALLENRALLAARRFPYIIPRLIAQLGEQQARLYRQLAICQLPRVEDRLLEILWLLAESWGRVTSAGMKVPLELTHQVLGELVGARRPTVTLALKELAERQAVVRQGGGWLLLEQPPAGVRRARSQLVGLAPDAVGGASPWAAEERMAEAHEPGAQEPGAHDHVAGTHDLQADAHQPTRGLEPEELHTATARLRATFDVNARRHGRLLELAQASRADSRALRELVSARRARTDSRHRLHHDDDPGDLTVAGRGEGEADHPALERASTAVGGIEDEILTD